MPLDILIRTYRLLWDQATAGNVPDLALAKEASAIAEKAAPYLHPRLSAVASLAGGKTLRDLVLESMGGKAQANVIEHQPQPALAVTKITDVQPESAQISPPPALAEVSGGDTPARGPFPLADRAMDDATRLEEFRREVREDQERQRASEPPHPYDCYGGSPYTLPARHSPRSAEAEDVEFHVRRIRRNMGLPD